MQKKPQENKQVHSVQIHSVNMTRQTIDERRIRLVAQAIVESLDKPFELSIVFVGTTRSRALNKRYRKKDTVASVLTFVLDDHTAEIVLCPKLIQQRGEPIEYYLIHGMGHVVGHTHDIDSASLAMHDFETNWLRHFHLCHLIASV